MSSKLATSTNYSRPARPAAVRLYNRIGAAAARPLELNELLAAAQHRVGAINFGDPSFREPLGVLLAAIEGEARIHPLGRAIMRTRLISLLENRLRLQALLAEQPEIADIPLRRPIVIAGLQRTGTTMLHRLLAADPAARTLRSWEALQSTPLPSEGQHGSLRRRAAGKAAEYGLRALAPEFFAIHPVESDAPEEDILLLDQAFMSQTPEATLHVPSYAAWLETHSSLPAYRYLVRSLQALSWQRSGSHWVLKTPHHMEYLRELRNAKTLRAVVLHRFIDRGEVEPDLPEIETPTPEPPKPEPPQTPPPAPKPGDHVPTTELDQDLNVAPGSIVVIRDEEWLVTSAEQGADGWLVRVRGLSELVAETTAAFYSSLDTIEVQDPKEAKVVPDGSSGYRDSRLWLEALIRKTPVPYGDQALTVSTRMLADNLGYQRAAVTKALDPQYIRPRILIADAVGLGKTLEIGMILSELVRRGRGERILIVTPKHVLEQMQHELWCRFALPFVRLDSTGIQKVRQKLPATRNPFTYFKRAIISIDTLKSPRYKAHLERQQWDAVVIDESHNLTNTGTQNNELARVLAPNTEALILASATPHNGKEESFAELLRLLDPTVVHADGTFTKDDVESLLIRRHRHSRDVAAEVGSDWAERAEPVHLLVQPSPAEDAVAAELSQTWLHPASGNSPYSGDTKALFGWTLAKAFLSSPAALAESIKQRRAKLDDKDPKQRIELKALATLDELNTAAVGEQAGKFAALVKRLKNIGVGKGSETRAVVFAERIATLTWLRNNLPSLLGLKDENVAMLHGGLSSKFATVTKRAPWLDVGGAEVWIKRDDQSSRLYGGGKVRKLDEAQKSGVILAAEDKDAFKKRLQGASNAKLLRLHKTGKSVTDRFGSKAKLVDAILDLHKRSKDQDYRTKLSTLPLGKLFDQVSSLEKSARRAAAKAGKKSAAPAKSAKPAAEKAPAKKAPAKKA